MPTKSSLSNVSGLRRNISPKDVSSSVMYYCLPNHPKHSDIKTLDHHFTVLMESVAHEFEQGRRG